MRLVASAIVASACFCFSAAALAALAFCRGDLLRFLGRGGGLLLGFLLRGLGERHCRGIVAVLAHRAAIEASVYSPGGVLSAARSSTASPARP